MITFLFPRNVEDIFIAFFFISVGNSLSFAYCFINTISAFSNFLKQFFFFWQQLKEILAKQAELGVEVAEIPSYYLSDSKKQQGHGREESRGPMTKNGRFQNKFGKRGRYDKKDRFAKKQRLHGNDSSDVPSLSWRKPTLLQKLLDTDVRRDKSRLLQVFRFMTLNSFFKDWPEKSLNFPSVVVKESGCGGTVVGEMSPCEGNDFSQVCVKTMDEVVDNGDEEDDDENDKDVQEEGEIIN